MKKMKVAQKLMVSFMIVTLLSVVLAGLGIFSSVTINSNYEYLVQSPIDQERALHDMKLQFTMMRYRAANFAMEAHNPDIINDTLTPQFNSVYTAFMQDLDLFLEHLNNDERRDAAIKQQKKDSIEKLRNLADQLKGIAEQMRSIALTGDGQAATTMLRDTIPLTNEFNALVDDMVATNIEYVSVESARMNTTSNTFVIVLITLAAACAISSIALALYISGSISKPLIIMAKFFKQAGVTGDITLSGVDIENIAQCSKLKDEIGQLSEGATAFLGHVTDSAKALEIIANGDLSSNIIVLSDKDTLGVSMKHMVDNLNNLFASVNISTSQVSSGSKQVADGAQSLAQGATEQAASIQELSSSVAEINNMAKESTQAAAEALDEVQQAGQLMGVCTEQMNQMLTAMQTIYEKSQRISKTTKVIDEIAFQTNILALNAAVEAARAGQHGKGFAVVAEEVRNLAAKSAEAARETGELIDSSSQSVAEGDRIVEQVNNSLLSLVALAKDQAAKIADIQSSSVQQSGAIEQINIGIDQVAQVVQQNSATAEESAAASEEMSSQSAILQGLVSQFTLKDDGMAYRSLPSYGQATQKRPAIPQSDSFAPHDGRSSDFGKY